jgi:hypothetical protein
LIVHPATPQRKGDQGRFRPFTDGAARTSSAKLAGMRKYGERVGIGLLIAAAAMVPWLYVLSGSLPDTTRVSGWSTAWLGLDVMEGLALLGTGLLLLRRDPRVSPVAAVTSALLLVDVWFDLTTSSSGRALLIAGAMALLVELPLCALCGLIAAGALSSNAAGGRSSSAAHAST